ncbi:PadR family transcriptional regulator [Actinoplanes sp. G11-F43]|uniref:PadR family transcriptional regulator n=1 Tax=Actinoplanes sp. G11-F43 TaxID=3424130 RepID=UPI003D351AFC
MERRRKVPNPLALVVLAWLSMQPLHPYELGRRLQGSGQDRHIKYTRSSLYMVVEQLAKAGFIAARETVREGQRPERTVYEITGSGRDEFYEWLRELVAQPREEYPQFAVALSLLSLLAPREAVDLLQKRHTALTVKIQETRKLVQEAADSGVRWIFLVEERYALAMLEAELVFLTELTGSLGDPDYIKSWQETFGSLT